MRNPKTNRTLEHSLHGLNPSPGKPMRPRNHTLAKILLFMMLAAGALIFPACSSGCTPDTDPTPNGGQALVLVHGWQGFGNEYHCDNGIVRYDGNNPTVGELADWFKALGYDVWLAHYTTSFWGTPRLEENAACLQTQFETVYRESGGRLIIVAHSMGGLVSRAAIGMLDNPGEKIEAIFTLGSPHAGLPAADYASWFHVPCWTQPGFCQLAINQMPQFNGQNPNQPPVNYYFIGGGGNPWPISELWKANAGDNDGAVGTFSAVGWAFPHQEFIPPGWPQQVLRRQLWTDEVHSAVLGKNSYYSFRDDGQQSHSFQCISAILGGNEPPPAICASPDPASVPPMGGMQSTTVEEINLQAGEVAELSIAVDTEARAVIFIAWDFGSPSIRLIDPLGVEVLPGDAEAQSGFDYSSAEGSGEFPYLVAYDFDQGRVGLWEMIIEADEPAYFSAFALLESDRKLEASTDEDRYQAGDQAVISAELTGEGIDDARVFGTVSMPEGMPDILVPMEYQGDGIYSGDFAVPDVEGFLLLEITAERDDQGVSFTRQVNLIVEITP